ncbi:MAG: hypothetical protein DRH57_07310 [Candidatus Cloacimonadota bacterium]|nr:MAG: hypothetical protein DRH57_07310 [Candidatus Cloacimonadota bacterium]
MEKYLTINKSNWAKIVIKKSRFFSRILFVSSNVEIENILQHIKREYKNSTHIVYAYRLNKGNYIEDYFTDAGEPKYSSGPPILQHLQQKNLVNVLLVVIRYYGGIKLGIGGLIRAYSESASIAIKNAKIIEKVIYYKIAVSTDYENIGNTIKLIKKNNGRIVDVKYGEQIEVITKITKDQFGKFSNFRIIEKLDDKYY